MSGGERGIRTPGPSQVNGFQDRRNRPLCHLSSRFRKCKNSIFCRHGKMFFQTTYLPVCCRRRWGVFTSCCALRSGCYLPSFLGLYIICLTVSMLYSADFSKPLCVLCLLGALSAPLQSPFGRSSVEKAIERPKGLRRGRDDVVSRRRRASSQCFCLSFRSQVQLAQRPVFGSALVQGRLNSFSLCNSILRPRAAIINARMPTAMARTMSIVFIFFS